MYLKYERPASLRKQQSNAPRSRHIYMRLRQRARRPKIIYSEKMSSSEWKVPLSWSLPCFVIFFPHAHRTNIYFWGRRNTEVLTSVSSMVATAMLLSLKWTVWIWSTYFGGVLAADLQALNMPFFKDLWACRSAAQKWIKWTEFLKHFSIFNYFFKCLNPVPEKRKGGSGLIDFFYWVSDWLIDEFINRFGEIQYIASTTLKIRGY